MISRGMWAAAAAALALAGCNRGADGEVAATVDGEKITQAQVSAEMRGVGGGEVVDPRQRGAILEQIIARKLFAESAREDGLLKSKEAAILKAAAIEAHEANVARRAILAKVKRPTGPEVQAFIQAHPEQFAERTGYLIERLYVDGRPGDDLIEALRPAKTLEEAEAVLQRRAIPYRRSTDEVDGLRANPELVAMLRRLDPGEPFVIPDGGGFSVGRVRDSVVRPVVGTEAQTIALGLMMQQRQQKALADRLEELRRAKVTYPGKKAT